MRFTTTCRIVALRLACFSVSALYASFVATPLWAGTLVLLVGAANGTSVPEYDGITGASLGNFTSGGGIISGPSSLGFGPNGNFFVGQWSYDGGIYQYDGHSGAFINRFVSFGYGGSDPFVFGSDQNLYATTFNSGGIVRYNGLTGAPLGTFANQTDGAIESMRFGPDGSLYANVVNMQSNIAEVLRFNGTTGASMGAFVPSGSGGLTYPADLVFGPDGNLYVSDLLNARVLRYDGTNGAFLGTFASGSGLLSPSGLAFGPDHNLYVADEASNDVLRFNGTTGAFMNIFASGTNPAPTFLLFAPVPEPSTGVLAVIACGMMWVLRRRFK